LSEQNLWLVWSYEHDAWWKPGRFGYTTDLEKAGRYRYNEALEICDNANRHAKFTHERMVHVANSSLIRALSALAMRKNNLDPGTSASV
jgi:hypothetical protein